MLCHVEHAQLDLLADLVSQALGVRHAPAVGFDRLTVDLQRLAAVLAVLVNEEQPDAGRPDLYATPRPILLPSSC